MNVRDVRVAHLVGVGGINMAAVAKLLLAAGVRVSGSDIAENDETRALSQRGATIALGHAAENVPADADVVIHTSAAPESNPEREEARRRGVPEMTNFAFLGQWFEDAKQILVTGTHGKSTTTAMLGLMLDRAKLDPTIVVGTKVPGLADGNLRIGSSDVLLIEGDEYERHFLEFHPYGVIVNNIELDHTDVYPTLEDFVGAFRALLDRVREGGIIVANVGDANVAALLASMREELSARRIRIVRFNGKAKGDWRFSFQRDGAMFGFALELDGVSLAYSLKVPGAFNALNAAGASLMALELGAQVPDIAETLASFPGVWRRFESLARREDVQWFSDFGHHPTAVASTLAGAREAFPGSRILLCFQPHHRNRTKHLFDDFVRCFTGADVLVFCEIYDVAGREQGEDADVSSRQLAERVLRYDAERGASRPVVYAENPNVALERIDSFVQPGDVVIVMGAGDIDAAAREYLKR